MVLAQVAKYFSQSSEDTPQRLVSNGADTGAPFLEHKKAGREKSIPMEEEEVELEATRPPYLHVR